MSADTSTMCVARTPVWRLVSVRVMCGHDNDSPQRLLQAPSVTMLNNEVWVFAHPVRLNNRMGSLENASQNILTRWPSDLCFCFSRKSAGPAQSVCGSGATATLMQSACLTSTPLLDRFSGVTENWLAFSAGKCSLSTHLSHTAPSSSLNISSHRAGRPRPGPSFETKLQSQSRRQAFPGLSLIHI